MNENNKIGIVTADAGILGAQLRLTAFSIRQNKVIREDLSWRLEMRLKTVDHQPKIYTSDAAQPVMIVTPGVYTLSVTWKGKEAAPREVQLVQNTSTDIQFDFDQLGFDDLNFDSEAISAGGEYFSDYDADRDFSRRSDERDAQSRHGAATRPLRDPSPPQGDMGAQFMAHPLLQKSAQFDGVDPTISPEPSENREALQLTLKQKLAAAPSTTPAPTPGWNR